MAEFKPSNRPYDVTHYAVRLSLDPTKSPNSFKATADIHLKPLTDLKEIQLDAEELSVEKVRLSTKAPVEFAQASSLLTLKFPQEKRRGTPLIIHVEYEGKIQSAHSGFFEVKDPDEKERGPLYFTHHEALGARKFFPCNDEPYDKATSEIAISLPSPFQAISNGKLISDKKFKREKTEWHEWHWKLDKPHPTYLVSLAVGRFKKVAKPYGTVEVSHFVGETKDKSAQYGLDATLKAMKFFETYLNVKYPWSKYATIGVPTFLWGGMENTSATHMNEERTVLVDPTSEFDKKRIVTLATHELAHQWFGDLVTMKWWDDLWLNESFASHLETIATKHHFQNEEAEIDLVLYTWDDYFRQEDGPRSHPIVNDKLKSPDDAFDAISYTKGENVLRMLSHYVGEDNFRKGLKHYLDRFAYSNATYRDFFASVETASKENLSGFRDSWLLQRGYPVITYDGSWDSKTSHYELNLSQHSNHSDDKALFDFKTTVVFHRQSTPVYHKEFMVKMDGAVLTQKFELLAEPEWVTVNGKSIVLSRVMQKKRNEDVLLMQAASDPEPLARIRASFDLMGNFREGGSMSNTAIESVVKTLTQDPSPYVRSAVLSELRKSKSRWLPDPIADALWKLSEKVSSDRGKDPAWAGDPHGWNQFRSHLYSALGKAKRKEVVPFLASVLGKANVGIDDLAEAAIGVALQGDDKSAEVLKTAQSLHNKRGYHYKFSLQYAYGAWENPKAASEIREVAKTCGSDMMGRYTRAVRDNQTLKNSPEWAAFLKDLILDEKSPFGEEVKSRILQTIEEVKNSSVKALLQSIEKESSSARLKEVAHTILEKNF